MTTLSSADRLSELVSAIRQDPSLPDRLVDDEAEIVRQALAGHDVHEIAGRLGQPEAAIWETLGRAARAATGQNVQSVETGGLGSDSDSGGGEGDSAR